MLITGCVTPPPPSAPTPAEPLRSVMPSRERTLEQDYRARAAALMQERSWAEALVQWELLLLLRPGASEYLAHLEATRKHIAETAADALRSADLARKRGELDTAATQYLRALAADTSNAVAAQGLREIERERTRRAYLNRPPRGVIGVITGTPGAPVELEPDYVRRTRPNNGDEAPPTQRR